MKRSKQPSIDLRKTVMQRIERDGIRMRTKSYFVFMNILKKTSLMLMIGLSLIGIVSLAYVFKNDVFTDYKTLLNGSAFIESLPWGGITVTTISILAALLLVKTILKSSPNFKFSYALCIWLVLVLGGLGLANNLSGETTPSIIARAAYFSNKDPAKLYGKITGIVDGNILKIKIGDATFTVYTPTKELNIGDKVLILGDKKGNNFYVKALEVIDYAPKKQIENKTEKDLEPSKPAEPKSEPIPAPVLKPAEPKSEPIPAPKPVYSITVDMVDKISSNKYKVNWSSNFILENGFKLVWSLSPNPTYPASPDPGVPYYYFDGGSSSSGYGYIKDSMGPGTYHGRVCQYLGGSCGIYSNDFTVTFP